MTPDNVNCSKLEQNQQLMALCCLTTSEVSALVLSCHSNICPLVVDLLQKLQWKQLSDWHNDRSISHSNTKKLEIISVTDINEASLHFRSSPGRCLFWKVQHSAALFSKCNYSSTWDGLEYFSVWHNMRIKYLSHEHSSRRTSFNTVFLQHPSFCFFLLQTHALFYFFHWLQIFLLSTHSLS